MFSNLTILGRLTTLFFPSVGKYLMPVRVGLGVCVCHQMIDLVKTSPCLVFASCLHLAHATAKSHSKIKKSEEKKKESAKLACQKRRQRQTSKKKKIKAKQKQVKSECRRSRKSRKRGWIYTIYHVRACISGCLINKCDIAGILFVCQLQPEMPFSLTAQLFVGSISPGGVEQGNRGTFYAYTYA